MNTLADEATTKPRSSNLRGRQVVAAIIFTMAALYVASIVPSVEIAWVSAILLLTIFLFSFEIVEIDVAAVLVMVLLGLSSLLAPVMGLNQGLVDNQHLFDGFGSNAVMSIVAVMIIGAGLDKTGIMKNVAAFILKVGRQHRRAHHSDCLGHGRFHFVLHAERWRGRAVSAGWSAASQRALVYRCRACSCLWASAPS